MFTDIRRMLLVFLIAIGFLWIAGAVVSVRGGGDDWQIFWAAGHAVGSSHLLDGSNFVYMPGAAWALWPFAHMTRDAGYFAYTAVLLLLAISAANMAANVYGISRYVALLMMLAWFPLTIALCLGQNAPVALFLVMAAVLALVKHRERAFGTAAALMLYKPTVAMPFLLLVPIFRLRKADGLITAICALWYLTSAAAIANWLWPQAYLHALASLYSVDRVVNGDFAISVTGVLIHLGMSPVTGWGLGAALLLTAIPVFALASRLEAATMAPVVGLAAMPHAYGYDALLLLPALWYLAGTKHPARIPILVIAYAVAPLYLLSRRLHFDPLGLEVWAVAIAWAVWRLRSALGQKSGDVAEDGEVTFGAHLPGEAGRAGDPGYT